MALQPTTERDAKDVGKLTVEQMVKLASLTLGQVTSQSTLHRISLEMHMRQWCIEQAVAYCATQGERTVSVTSVASDISDFIKEPLNSVA